MHCKKNKNQKYLHIHLRMDILREIIRQIVNK